MSFRPDPKPAVKPKKAKQPLKRSAIKKRAVKSNPKTFGEAVRKRRKPTGEMQVFREIWSEREHICNWCECNLGNEIAPIFFDHIVPKSKAPALRLEKTNIRLLCPECHEIRHYGTKDQIAQRIKSKN